MAVLASLAALGAGFLATTEQGRLTLLVVAMIAFLFWKPLPVVVLLLVFGQEINPAHGQSGLTVLGHEIYFVQFLNLPILFFILSMAAIFTLMKPHRQPISPLSAAGSRPIIWTLGILVFLLLLTAVAEGISPASTFGQVLRPLIVFTLAWLISGRTESSSDIKLTYDVVWISIVILALLGLQAALAGSGASIGGQLVYYDTATAAISAAALLTIVRRPRLRALELIGVCASACVLLVSFRRSVLIGIAVIVFTACLTSSAFRRVTVRILLSFIGLIFVGMLTVPDLLYSFWQRLILSLDAFDGTATDSSTAGHIDDISIGLKYALSNPWGFGALSNQLPGLFTKGDFLYVHNEILLIWLKFGIVAAASFVLFMIALAIPATKILVTTKAQTDTWRMSASYFVILYILTSVSAPFLMTTSRWPALLGLVIGILMRPDPQERIFAVDAPLRQQEDSHRV